MPEPIEAPADAERESAIVPAPPRVPSLRPVHPAVQAIDHLGEIIAVCIAGYLCALGRADFDRFAVFSCIVLGVQTGIRNISARTRAVGVSGVVGLVVASLASSHVLHRVITGALALSLVVAAAGL
jgi:hypothetical protein